MDGFEFNKKRQFKVHLVHAVDLRVIKELEKFIIKNDFKDPHVAYLATAKSKNKKLQASSYSEVTETFFKLGITKEHDLMIIKSEHDEMVKRFEKSGFIEVMDGYIKENTIL